MAGLLLAISRRTVRAVPQVRQVTPDAAIEAAAILRQVNKDHRHVHTYRGGSQGCSCGLRDMAMRGNSAWIWGHVAEAGAAALSAAGFGLVHKEEAPHGND